MYQFASFLCSNMIDLWHNSNTGEKMSDEINTRIEETFWELFDGCAKEGESMDLTEKWIWLQKWENNLKCYSEVSTECKDSGF
jgi:hypothetical protein